MKCLLCKVQPRKCLLSDLLGGWAVWTPGDVDNWEWNPSPFLQLRPGFLDLRYLPFQTTPASHSFCRNQYTPGIWQKPCHSSKPYGRSLILILLNKPLSHGKAKWVDVTLCRFLGDNKLWFCAFWCGCVSQTFVALINTPEEQFRGEKIDLVHSFRGFNPQLFSLDF